MQNQTEIDISLVSSEDLMQELMRRYEQVIIISENRKSSGTLDIKVKTARGELTKPDDEFDITFVADMLMTTLETLLKDYMGFGDGSNNPQD